MKSAHPDDAAASGELLVMVSGTSIELKAIATRLEKAGVKVRELETLDAAEPSPIPTLLLCDLARDGALASAERFYSGLTAEVREHVEVVALGTARAELSDAEAALLAKARQRYRRPIDVQGLSDEILATLRKPRPSVRPQ